MFDFKRNKKGFSLVETTIGMMLLGFSVSAGINLVMLNARMMKINEIDRVTSDIALARISEIEHSPFSIVSTDSGEYPNEEFTQVNHLGEEDNDGLYLRSTEVSNSSLSDMTYVSKIVKVNVYRADVKPSGQIVQPDPQDLANDPYSFRGEVAETIIFANRSSSGRRLQ